jgi:hypothetical protein
MKPILFAASLLMVGTAIASAADFYPPVRLKVGDAAIRVESPGYACPCWADIHGEKHLLVGQFQQGKVRLFKHLGAEQFAPGTWLHADGAVAEVPGVW